jgi:hypothetical protein
MKIRELIIQLLNEDLDSEIAIQCLAPYYEDAMPVEGILNHSKNPNLVMLIPEIKLVQSNAIHD